MKVDICAMKSPTQKNNKAELCLTQGPEIESLETKCMISGASITRASEVGRVAGVAWDMAAGRDARVAVTNNTSNSCVALFW